jgi:hypothetical protein
MRWRQCGETGKFIPVDEAAARRDGLVVRGDIADFISPIDQTVISGNKQYREHCEKHGVVNAAEFTPEYYAGKAAERAQLFENTNNKEKLALRRDLYERLTQAERG